MNDEAFERLTKILIAGGPYTKQQLKDRVNEMVERSELSSNDAAAWLTRFFGTEDKN